MEERRDRNALTSGLVLLILGLLFLLANFGYFSWSGWGRLWPLILIVLGLLMLRRHAAGSDLVSPAEPPASSEPIPPAAQAPRRAAYPTGAIILIGLGVAFLLQDYIGGNVFPAVVLIVIGAALLLRDRQRR